MKLNVLDGPLAPAEGESLVRSYHCTSLSSGFLGLKAEGFLNVTNKRVVFYAAGSSYGGKSIIQSEVPIADVSGINSYKGTSFSLWRLLMALVVSFVLGSVLSAIVSALVGAVIYRSSSYGLIEATFYIVPLLPIVGSFFLSRSSILRSVLATSGVMLFAGAGALNSFGGLLGSLTGSGSGLGVLLTPIAFIYALVCYYWYSRGQTIALTIGSKGGSSTPIAVSGVTGFNNTAAVRALTAEPAEDADAVIKELGALITDIQALGDLGIQKWVQAQASQSGAATVRF